MSLRIACLLLLFAIVYAEDTTGAFDFKAIRPGEDGSTSDRLEILCKFDISKTDYKSVVNMFVYDGMIDSTRPYNPVGLINDVNVFHSGIMQIDVTGQMENPTTVDIKFKSAKDGYKTAYQCKVEVEDSNGVKKTLHSDIIRVVTCEESPCVKTQSDEAEEEKPDECCLANEDIALNSKSIEDMREQIIGLSAQITHLSEKLDQEAGSNAKKYEGVKDELDDVKLAQEQQEKILSTVLSIDKDKYHVSNLYQGHIYIASKKDAAFDIHDTNQVCKDAGGYLVELDDKDEQSFVKNFEQATGYLRYYTGANDVESEGNFVYYTSKMPVEYVTWKNGEPNDTNGNEDCVEIQPAGLNDMSCNRNARYICEIPLFED